ncbi:MAG: alanine racemase [Streptomycetaceae bacterium]|nr:alanine racemase [Streptomycetaceae bacterium]
MDDGALDALRAERVDFRFKGLPPDAEGLTVGELAAQRRLLFDGGFTTPLLTLCGPALDHNLAQLGAFAAKHGLAFAPHGKTSMAPQLFARQLAHGAWGITAAIPSQMRMYRAYGVQRIFLANEVVDEAALHWLARELDADPGFRFIAYVDSVRGVELMDAALPRQIDIPVEVVVELGAPGGRSGVRGEAVAFEVAEAVAASARLRLVGVAGYEGEIPEQTEPAVREWLHQLVGLVRRFDAAALLADAEEIVVSAGGSAWFDTVAEALVALTGLSKPVLKLLRSGAYVTHDNGRYRAVTPFRDRIPGEGSLQAAFRLWTQVLSRPEPGLAVVNAGKRDVSYDMDLPEPQLVRRAGGPPAPADGMRVTRLADQHAFVELPESSPLAVGDWLALGVSHPCTTFDKWQLIPLVAQDGTVTDYIRTFF